jgi:hypothetical protein
MELIPDGVEGDEIFGEESSGIFEVFFLQDCELD